MAAQRRIGARPAAALCYAPPVSERASTPTGRLRIALELSGLAEQLVEQRLRRENPAASDAEIKAWVRKWYQTRPGAEHGDADGRPISWPRVPA